MTNLLEQLFATLGGTTGNLIIALVILVGGWLVALAIQAGVRALLRRTDLDNRLMSGLAGPDTAARIQIEDLIARIVYYLIMLLVLVAFFDRLQLPAVTEPLNALLSTIFAFAPQILAAALLLGLAWLLATGARFAIKRLFGATDWEERLAGQAGIEDIEKTSISDTLANLVYWFIFLLFLPAVLGALKMEGLLAPVQGMVDQLLSALPNALGAGLILLIGWFVARIVRQIITNLLATAGADKLGERVGLSTALGEQALSGLIGTIIYTLILISVLIAALNALNIEAISGPATAMLETVLAAIPAIFGAGIVLGIAYFVGKLVADLVSNLLTGIGFNKVLVWIGLGSEPTAGERTPAEVVGYLVLVAIMLFSLIEAANLLGFSLLADLVAQIIGYAGQVAVAVVVFGLGLYFANLARNIILATGGLQSNLLAQGARLAIIIFSGALALRQTGIAQDIVNLTFGLLLGAVAVATAIAFGLGCREIAAREMDKFLASMRSEDS